MVLMCSAGSGAELDITMAHIHSCDITNRAAKQERTAEYREKMKKATYDTDCPANEHPG